MGKVVIQNVTISPNPVNTKASFKISVTALQGQDEPTRYRLAFRLGDVKGNKLANNK